MADLLLNSSAVIVCPHGGQWQPGARNWRVKLSGAFCFTVGDVVTIVGCPAPAPCAIAQAVSGSQRVRSSGEALLTTASILVTNNGQQLVIANPGQFRSKGS